jgi:hypothetical protein
VHSVQELSACIAGATGNRETRATNMNAESSRSHLIFTLELENTATGNSSGNGNGKKSAVRLRAFALVDAIEGFGCLPPLRRLNDPKLEVSFVVFQGVDTSIYDACLQFPPFHVVCGFPLFLPPKRVLWTRWWAQRWGSRSRSGASST